jgi:outer membrane receptor protein involved in Fe transport
MNKTGNTLRRLPWQRSVAAAVALAISGVAMAQSNAVGSIFGSSGEAGGTVVITNTATGVSRSVSVDSNGRFQIPALPVGTYKVELQKDGRTVEERESVLVSIGAGSQVNFGESVLEEVLVTAGRSIIDVSATDTRTVFTAQDLERIAVKQSIEDIALLAPGSVRGDARYNTNRGQPSVSFGGSGANENAFYINGYAVTDPTKGLGSSSLPFNSIAQYQLLTGGYGAEFGRSTGGVVNIVTKSGTNQWAAGAQVTYTPDSWTKRSPDFYRPANGTPSDNLLYSDASDRETDSVIYNAYVSGPIIQDKLFFFLSGELEKRTVDGPQALIADTYRNRGSQDGPTGWHDRNIDVPRWMAKVDYAFAEGQSLELTGISDVRKEKRRYYAFYNNTLPSGADQTKYGVNSLLTKGTVNQGGFDYKDGGELYIAKYTGTITDNLIFTALYGHQRTAHDIVPFGYDPSIIAVRDARTRVTPLPNVGSFATLNDPHAYDKTSGYRFDFEWIAGDHDFRLGYDKQELTYKDGVVTTGPEGYFWQYFDVPPEDIGELIQGAGGAVAPASGQYVTKVRTERGGTFTTDQYAFYLEDRWQIADTVQLTLGLRNESFKNYNADKVVFLDQSDQWAPRIGVSWDVKGDSSLRAFANAGRYHLAIPLNLAFRQVGASLGTSEYYSFTGIDANGIPQGLVALGNGPYSSNQEYGQARDPLKAAAKGLKPYYQDEFSLGGEAKVFGDLKAGLRLTYRSLKSQIDDNCDWRPALNWAVSQGLVSGVDEEEIIAPGLDDLAESYAVQLYECKIINPGVDNTMVFSNPDGTYVDAKITAEQFGLPKLKRTYKGIDLFLEHPFRNKWYGKIDYTLSWNKGNAEGMLYSDSGQPDVAVTANWDSPELMDGGYGWLPNDRRHQIKFFGFYEFSPEWRVSGTLTAASGRPKSYAGTYEGEPLLSVDGKVGPDALTDKEYNDAYVTYNGPYYHWVDGVVSARGAGGRLPWTTLLDLGVTYAPSYFKNQLKLGVDVFNVFDSIETQSSVDQLRLANNAINPNGGMPLSYNVGRSVRVTLRYDWQ